MFSCVAPLSCACRWRSVPLLLLREVQRWRRPSSTAALRESRSDCRESTEVARLQEQSLLELRQNYKVIWKKPGTSQELLIGQAAGGGEVGHSHASQHQLKFLQQTCSVGCRQLFFCSRIQAFGLLLKSCTQGSLVSF